MPRRSAPFWKTVICLIALCVSGPALSANVLIVYSQIAEPYTSFMWHFHRALKGHDQEITFNTINLNNREKIINHLLPNQLKTSPDIIITIGTVALRAIRDQKILKANIPVLFGVVTDPVGEKVIDGFNIKPSGRFSGISYAIDIRDRLRQMKQVFPKAKKIGIIYSTMPQSVSYKKWLDEVALEEEFNDLNFVFRRIGMLPYANGPRDMVHTAKRHARALKDQVDIFLSPNDQMGILPEFAQMILRETQKPVYGLGKKDALAPMAAVASSHPKLSLAGQKLAHQLLKLINGTPISDIPAEQPDFELVVNPATARHFNITLPK